MNPSRIFFLVTVLLASVLSFSQAQDTSRQDSLFHSFVTPPGSARPRVWWHWMNGNITKDGIRKDLLWMHHAGIGGFMNFDAAFMTPQVVPKRLVYMTPEWKDAFQFTTRLADSLKLEMAIAGSPGWSMTGGPWVAPKDGMKKLVWSETRVKGGKPFTGTLPKPPAVTGAYQNIPLQGSFGAPPPAAPSYAEDVAVIAVKLPSDDMTISELNPKVTSSGGTFTLNQLTDGDLVKGNMLPADTLAGHAWIQFEFAGPKTISAITIAGGGQREQWGIAKPWEGRSLAFSTDGKNFQSITTIPIGGVLSQTISFLPVTARYFRVIVANPVLDPKSVAALFTGQTRPAPGTEIAEIVLHTASRVNHAEEKAGFASPYDLAAFPTPPVNDAIAAADVIDLTSKMNPDGALTWTAPAGNWKILRFGYSLTGKMNHPASPEATGLEVDKLDAQAVRNYFDNYLGQYKSATGGLMGARGLQYMVIDSYESEQETWTPKMSEEFRKRRGYDLLPWMPVLTGHIITSAEASEQFLWDWRKTISEMLADNHYNQLTSILDEHGMKRYTESQENGRVFVGDGMDVKRTAAVPMAAIWSSEGFGSTFAMSQADIRESASVAHIYGQNIVAAESFTAFGLAGNAWAYSPEKLKPVADLALASGLNRFVIHTSVHQPVDDKVPGLGLGPFGQWFTRHETWSGQARAWTDYLARSSAMLQQGRFAADVLIYYGEDNNITGLYGEKLPDVPRGYAYDFINAHALINRLNVENGKLVTPNGMSYSVLVLDQNAKRMSLAVLRRIAALAKAGAVVTGVKPEIAGGVLDNASEFNTLVNEIWNAERKNVFYGKSLGEVLDAVRIQPDFYYTKAAAGQEILFVHRTLPGAEIYWVNNRTNQDQKLEAAFRVVGRRPEIWNPVNGKTLPVSYTMEPGATKVSLDMLPADAFFVVFRENTAIGKQVVPMPVLSTLADISRGWTITFQEGRGAPPAVKADSLSSWSANDDAGVKYFSGTGVYRRPFNVPKSWLKNKPKLLIDLGDVASLAEVIVNGQSLGVVWKKPFQVDITSAVKAGVNSIEIRVTNLWVNRLIGDAQPGTQTKLTFTTLPFYKPDAPLLPSGLLGPVKILSVR